MTHTAASIALSIQPPLGPTPSMHDDPLRRLRSGKVGLSGAVKRVCGHRTLWTVILELEHVIYSLVEGTWKVTGNTVCLGSVMKLLSSAAPGSYCRMAHRIDILVPWLAEVSGIMSHL